jgi:hypothetical protein
MLGRRFEPKAPTDFPDEAAFSAAALALAFGWLYYVEHYLNPRAIQWNLFHIEQTRGKAHNGPRSAGRPRELSPVSKLAAQDEPPQSVAGILGVSRAAF